MIRFSFLLTILLLLSKCSLTDQASAAVEKLPKDVRAIWDIPYVSDGHDRQKLDLYMPTDSDGPPRPLLIRIHGGAWRHGDKSAQRGAANFVKRGFVAAAINYRLSQHAVFPAQIKDCKSAVRWLRAHAAEYNIDPNRIVAMGTSAGGHLASLLGTAGDTREFDVGENLEFPSKVHAVINYYGLIDFPKAVATPGYERIRSATSQLVGGPLEQNLLLAVKANPITHVSKEDPPFLVLHGDSDPMVPLNQSELLTKSLQEAGVPVEFHVIQGGEHGGKAFKTHEVKKILNRFLDGVIGNRDGL